MERVEITEDVAEAIEEYMDEVTKSGWRDEGTSKGAFVAEHFEQDWRKYEDGQYTALNKITTYQLMRILVDGYLVK